MSETKLYYPFRYFHDAIYTVAIYGSNAPLIVKGNLVLREYFEDDEKNVPDIEHTSEFIKDSIYYETNKVIRQQLFDYYSGRRILKEVPLSRLGNEYVLVYNTAEIPSTRHDDHLSIVQDVDPHAVGVAIILKRGTDGSILWMDEREARFVQSMLK